MLCIWGIRITIVFPDTIRNRCASDPGQPGQIEAQYRLDKKEEKIRPYGLLVKNI